LNTALESLACGVPMVVLPVTYDQPGVGARVEWAGVGRSIPVARLLRLKLDNLIVTPHVAWASQESLANLAEQLILNIESFVLGSLRNLVA
jgi:UDP:flavonoid glycosyltransferase YjiC (YdhE family)